MLALYELHERVPATRPTCRAERDHAGGIGIAPYRTRVEEQREALSRQPREDARGSILRLIDAQRAFEEAEAQALAGWPGGSIDVVETFLSPTSVESNVIAFGGWGGLFGVDVAGWNSEADTRVVKTGRKHGIN